MNNASGLSWSPAWNPWLIERDGGDRLQSAAMSALTSVSTTDNPETLELRRLHAEIRVCRRCVDAGLIDAANPVFRGRRGHRLMIVGQAPGASGHLNAVPYAGASGKTLRGWL